MSFPAEQLAALIRKGYEKGYFFFNPKLSLKFYIWPYFSQSLNRQSQQLAELRMKESTDRPDSPQSGNNSEQVSLSTVNYGSRIASI